MMKAALTYYREAQKVEKPKKITLGELASSNSGRLQLRRRRAAKKNIEFTPAEKSLMRLVQNGQVGMLIAHYAPKVS